MDINNPDFAKWFTKTVRELAREEAKKVVLEQQNLIVGEVETGGSGATISVYINNSTTAVDVKNPNGLTLSTGQLVAIIYPNGRNDGEKYIDRVL